MNPNNSNPASGSPPHSWVGGCHELRRLLRSGVVADCLETLLVNHTNTLTTAQLTRKTGFSWGSVMQNITLMLKYRLVERKVNRRLLLTCAGIEAAEHIHQYHEIMRKAHNVVSETK